ncbi:STAS domain-containing protein [Balneolaceae bacterium ANBcel3]|nr:STAS domain-containing protein [Balneolaceae bacterium ANBcel3]
MNFNQQKKGDVTILELEGSIDSKTAGEIQNKIMDIVLNSQKLILVFSKVTFVSSAGLRLLLMIYRQVTSKKGKVVLVDVSEEIRDIMEMTGFINFFSISKTVDEALKEI